MTAFYCINQPDLTGPACQVTLNQIIPRGYGETGFFFTKTGSYLLPDIVVAPAGYCHQSGVLFWCMFPDSMVLAANSTAGCYVWGDGSNTPQRVIYHSGTYYVSYFSSCSYQPILFTRVRWSPGSKAALTCSWES